MSTPCCTITCSVECFLSRRGENQGRTNRIQDPTKSLQLQLEIILLALQLSEGEVRGVAVRNRRRGWSRRDSGCVKIAHIQFIDDPNSIGMLCLSSWSCSSIQDIELSRWWIYEVEGSRIQPADE